MRILFGIVIACGACGSDKAGNETPDGPASGDGPADSAPQPLTLDCTSYCGAILTRCTDVRAQYGTMAECVASCGLLPVGTLGEMAGNTLGCRVYHTEAAGEDAEAHCEHAGPGGGSMCGATLCEGFCSIAPTTCPTQWQANNCATRCGQLTSTPPYNIASSGDTAECRLYHLTAATADPTTHCPHTDRMTSATCQ